MTPGAVIFDVDGDNLNDVDAGLTNGVHVIGFARDPGRRTRLRAAGAPVVTGDHASAIEAIRRCLAGEPSYERR